MMMNMQSIYISLSEMSGFQLIYILLLLILEIYITNKGLKMLVEERKNPYLRHYKSFKFIIFASCIPVFISLYIGFQ